MIVEIGTVAACGTAGFLFFRGFHHAGALTRMIGDGLRANNPERPADRDAPPIALLDTVLAEQDRMWQREEERLFHQVPSAWWLDPKRWGATIAAPLCKHCGKGRYVSKGDTLLCDQCGDYRQVKSGLLNPQATIRVKTVYPLRDCPNCHTDKAVIVLNTAGDEVTMWHCGACMAEFTRKGETRKSKRARADRVAKYPVPKRMTADDVFPPLPCGCPHSTPVNIGKKGGWDVSVCYKCDAWWDFPSNSGDKRKLAQGEKVHRPDYDLDMPMPPPTR